MPLFKNIYGDTQLTGVQNPSVLETVVTITGDTTPTLTTHDIVAAKFSVINNVGTDPGTSNLIAYWKLDEFTGDTIVIDSSGNLNHGTVEGTNKDGWVDGKVNNAFNFYGTDERIDFGNSSPIADIGNGDNSFSFWMKSKDSDPLSYGRLFEKWTGTDTIGLYSNSTNNELRFAWKVGGVGTADNFSVAPFDATWHHIVIVINRTTDLAYCYMDGYLDSTTINISTAPTDCSNAANFSIGASNSGATPYEGDIDEFRVYNKVLTANEALFLFANPPGFIVGSQNPVGNANVNPLEVSGGGIVFNQLASAPSVGSPYKGVLYLKDDKGLYYVDQDNNDIPIVANFEETWHPLEGDTGLWYQGPVVIGDSVVDSTIGSTYVLDIRGKILAQNIIITKEVASNSYGFQLEEVGDSVPRYGLKYGTAGTIGDTNLMALTNRAAGGAVAIMANTGSAGAESEIARFLYNGSPKVSIGDTNPQGILHVYGGETNSAIINGIGGVGSYSTSYSWITLAGNQGVATAGSKGWHFVARSDSYSVAAEQNNLMLYNWDGTTWSVPIMVWDYLTGHVGFGRAPTTEFDFYRASEHLKLMIETGLVNGEAALQFKNVAQRWQLAVTTANMFTLFDVTNSKVPLTIEPGAPTNSLYLASGGGVLIHTDTSLHPTLDTIESYGSFSIIGRTSNSDATVKATRFCVSHYTNAEEPVGLMYGVGDVTDNIVYIGGGTSNVNAVTLIRFYTAANNTTLTGTERARINSSGNFLIGKTSDDGGLLQVAGTISLYDGTNKDRTIAFANDAQIFWDESEDRFELDKILLITEGDTDPAIKLEKTSTDAGSGTIVYNSADASLDFIIA